MRPWQVVLVFFAATIAFIVARGRLPGRPRRFWFGVAAVGLLVVLALAATATGGPSATPTPRAALADADYRAVDVRDLAKNPDAYRGAPIRLDGEVFNIREQGGATFLQMYVPTPGGAPLDRQPVAVRYNGSLPNVYERTKVAVFGVGDGVERGTNAFGATTTQPSVAADRVILSP